MKKKILFWTAILLGMLNIAIGISSVVFSRLNGVGWLTILADGGWILALSMTSVALLIALLRPGNPLGWVFFAIGFFQGLVSFAMQYAMYTLVTSPGSFAGGEYHVVAGCNWLVPRLSLLLNLRHPALSQPGNCPHRAGAYSAGCASPDRFFIPTGIIRVASSRASNSCSTPNSLSLSPRASWVFLPISPSRWCSCVGSACLVSLIIATARLTSSIRRQIKWVAFAAGIFLAMELLQAIPAVYNFLTDNNLTYLVVVPAFRSHCRLRWAWRSCATACGMIDILINRTLVYVPLTGILAGLYAASISLLQRTFVAITGTRSDGAIVLTTLILTSTFTPIKNALQSLVDRRFKSPAEPLAALKTFKRQIQAVEEVVDRESAARRFLDESTSALQASCGAIFLSQKGQSRRSLRHRELGNWPRNSYHSNWERKKPPRHAVPGSPPGWDALYPGRDHLGGSSGRETWESPGTGGAA